MSLLFFLFLRAYLTRLLRLLQCLVELAGDGERFVAAYIKRSIDDNILPCIAGDIWGENGVSLFAMLAYFIDDDFALIELMVGMIPFSDVNHNGHNIAHTTKVRNYFCW